MPRYIDISEGKLPVHWRRSDAKSICGQPCIGIVRYEDLQNMPVADVKEVTHGKWTQIESYNYDGSLDAQECSHCKMGIVKVHGYDDYTYCPYCAARMDGGTQ